MTSRHEQFGTLPDGAPVERVKIAGGGLTAQVLTYGATLQDLRLDGFSHPLVLGAPNLAPYLGPMAYFGAIVGRFSNRISKGRFMLDGQTFQLATNWLGHHTLHGGPQGTGQKNWALDEVRDDRLRLGLILPDGDMGFPGTLRVTATIALLADGILQIDIQATTDAPTPCSFAHHSYFNLDGSPAITDHKLWVNAESYLPVDAEMLPTGEIAPLEGTALDFRVPRRIGPANIDNNFCLSDAPTPLRPVARLQSSANGLSMSVETTEPGLQVYTATHIRPQGPVGLGGKPYGPLAGIALEPQGWPDAPNHAAFPCAILRPGAIYRQKVRYQFGKGRRG